jgi:hypothetical protein
MKSKPADQDTAERTPSHGGAPTQDAATLATVIAGAESGLSADRHDSR